MAKEVMEHPSWYQSVKRSKLAAPTAKGVNKTNVWSKSSKLSAAAASHFEQSSIKQYTLPKMTKQVKGKLEENLALHHYITGSSFQKLKKNTLNWYFNAASLMWYCLIKRLVGSLLNTMHEEMEKQIDDNLAASVSEICLTTDAWTNISNDPIVNYMAVSSETSMSLESVCTGEQRACNWLYHTGFEENDGKIYKCQWRYHWYYQSLLESMENPGERLPWQILSWLCVTWSSFIS